MNFLKTTIKRAFSQFGLKITRINQSLPGHVAIMDHVGVSTVFDVGANEGQFAKELLYSGYVGKIISFEPTRLAHQKLCRNSRPYKNWFVHPRAALGASLGITKINVAGNSAASSSILEMGETHKDSSPSSAYVGSEHVDMITLDSIYSEYIEDSDIVCLKLDVQGYEEHVLDGAQDTLDKVRAVKLELSLVSLYENDRLYPYYFRRLESLGFSLWDLEAGHRHPATGQLLQFDALFVRE